jgi:hypothetical protein
LPGLNYRDFKMLMNSKANKDEFESLKGQKANKADAENIMKTIEGIHR